MQLDVKLFASVREAVGSESVPVTLDTGDRVKDLLEDLCQRFPAIAGQRAALGVAVNHEMSAVERVLVVGDEVALIPPVGGG
jgi:molybdopterin converting factor subunit 1